MKRIMFFQIIFFLLVLAKFQLFAQAEINAGFVSTYFGGTNGEHNVYCAVDPFGNIILAGHTYSANLPVKNAYQPVFQGGNPNADAFIAKFTPDLSDLIFSTFLGGNDYDEIKDVAVDKVGNIYVTGLTESRNFPVSDNALYKTYLGGDYDAFLAKYNTDGQLLYSTYFGGSKADLGYVITVDEQKNVYIAGGTNSANQPVVAAYQTSLAGSDDIFISKFNIENNILLYSTYLGGSSNDNPASITVDETENIFITGSTESDNFPVRNALQNNYIGNTDGFIIKITASNELVYSTFWGGNGADNVANLQIDTDNNIFFVSSSSSQNLPCSDNAFSKNNNGGNDLVIGKINSECDSLLYMSYFGGNGNDNGQIHLLNNGAVAITGTTTSSNFPVTDNAWDKQIANSDFFITLLNLETKENLYSTFFGGSMDDWASDSFSANDSTIYLCGITQSGNFPTSPNAYIKNYRQNNDEALIGFTFKSPVTSLEKTQDPSLKSFRLLQNYPNPFNPTTTIYYQLAENILVKLQIYDILGHEIKTLVDSYLSAGEHSIEWNGTDEANNPVSSGIYFYSLKSNDTILQRKMVLIR